MRAKDLEKLAFNESWQGRAVSPGELSQSGGLPELVLPSLAGAYFLGGTRLGRVLTSPVRYPIKMLSRVPGVKPAVKAVGTAPFKAAKSVASFAGSQMGKRPIQTTAKGLAVAATMPYAMDLASSKNYQAKLHRSSVPGSAQNFGRSKYRFLDASDGEGGPVKMASPMTKLVKEAGFTDTAKKVYEALGGGDNKFLLNALAGGAGAYTVSSLLGPTLQTAGKKTERWVHPAQTRVDAEEEAEKLKAKEIGSFYAEQARKKLEAAKASKTDVPQAQMVLENLKKSDPYISAASKDPKLKPVIASTASTVFKFAPDVAKDERAMQSVLTEAISSPEGGLSYQTIKSLSETQRNIMGG